MKEIIENKTAWDLVRELIEIESSIKLNEERIKRMKNEHLVNAYMEEVEREIKRKSKIRRILEETKIDNDSCFNIYLVLKYMDVEILKLNYKLEKLNDNILERIISKEIDIILVDFLRLKNKLKSCKIKNNNS